MQADDLDLDRKKVTLYLHPDTGADRMALQQIATVLRKHRGDLYRQALIAGLALHHIDDRLPELLTALFTKPLTTETVMEFISTTTGWQPLDEKILAAIQTIGCSSDTPAEKVQASDSDELAQVKSKLASFI